MNHICMVRADLVGLSRILVLQQIDVGTLPSTELASGELGVGRRMDLLARHARLQEQQRTAIAELGVEVAHELNSLSRDAAGQSLGHRKKV